MDVNEHTLVFRQSKDNEYCLRNIPSKYYVYALKVGEKLYIGSSTEVIARMRQHLYDMHKGTHYNAYMNQAFKECEDVSGYILDSADCKSDILKKEQFYIDKYSPYLNIGIASSKRGNYSYSKKKWASLPRKRPVNYPVDKETFKKMLNIKSQFRIDLRELSYVAMISFIKQYYHNEELTADGLKLVDEIMSNIDASLF